MKKPITSKDPRKRLIVATFKAAYCCTRVTEVKEDETFFYANVANWDREKQRYVNRRPMFFAKTQLYLRNTESYGIGRLP